MKLVLRVLAGKTESQNEMEWKKEYHVSGNSDSRDEIGEGNKLSSIATLSVSG